MRGRSRFFLRDRVGEERTRRKFLLRPRRFEARYWRWLEWANIRECIMEINTGARTIEDRYMWMWREIGFVDKED